MQNKTPAKIKDLNLRVHSELTRIEKIVDDKLISDTGSTDVMPLNPPGGPAVPTLNKTLWTDKWNALVTSLTTFITIDRSVPYKKLMMTTANHSMNKLDQALADPVKFENLMDFGGLVNSLAPKNATNILHTDLDAFKVVVDGAWAAEQAKIDTFSTKVTDALTNKGIEAMMKNPATAAAAKSQGFTEGFKNITHTLPM